MFTFVQICSSYLFVFSLGKFGLLPDFLLLYKKTLKKLSFCNPYKHYKVKNKSIFFYIYACLLNILFYICTNKDRNKHKN